MGSDSLFGVPFEPSQVIFKLKSQFQSCLVKHVNFLQDAVLL